MIATKAFLDIGPRDGSDCIGDPEAVLGEQPRTPGPWVAVRQDFRRLDAPEPFYTVGPSEFTTIADVRAGSDDDDLPQQVVGNAWLIAAAPDLLAALQVMLPEGWRDGSMDHVPGVAAARAAIAKATGVEVA